MACDAVSHQYEISAHVAQTSFRVETSNGVLKWRLFSQGEQLENW